MPHMMSPHSRHAIYAHHQPYYYDLPGQTYPHPAVASNYINPYYAPPGAQLNPSMRMPYPGYDDYGYGPAFHPYHLGHPFEGSPSQMMRSPHMHPQHMLSVHKSASKSKRRSGEPKGVSIDRGSCASVTARARAAQLNPRQLNFNDEMVDTDHNRVIVFENVDTSEPVAGEDQSMCNSRAAKPTENDDDHFEVVKIKFHQPVDKKSRVVHSQPRCSEAGAKASGAAQHRLNLGESLVGEPCEGQSRQKTMQSSHTKCGEIRRSQDNQPSIISIKSS